YCLSHRRFLRQVLFGELIASNACLSSTQVNQPLPWVYPVVRKSSLLKYKCPLHNPISRTYRVIASKGSVYKFYYSKGASGLFHWLKKHFDPCPAILWSGRMNNDSHCCIFSCI